MKYEWDENKNKINYVKHKISFELAKLAFDDPLHRTQFDRVADNEERWHTLGMIQNQLLALVVHTYRTVDDEEVIRIISARKATKHERRLYEQFQ